MIAVLFVGSGRPEDKVYDQAYERRISNIALRLGADKVGWYTSPPFPGKKVFMLAPRDRCPGAKINLIEYQHPEDAVYVLGPEYADWDVSDLITDGDDVVTLNLGSEQSMFSEGVLAIVLWDRRVKGERRGADG